MAQSDVIALLGITYGQPDPYGIRPRVETRREIRCKVSSASQSEYFGGGRNGLNPACKFEVFDGDYQGETVAEYHGQRLTIYRTYLVPGTHRLELHGERKGGTNGTKDAG